MALLTVEQAAKRLGKTERTIRRWLAEGTLTPYHPSHGRKDKYLVDDSEVEQLATELVQEGQPGPEDQVRDTSSLEQRVTALESRLEKLEQAILRLGNVEPLPVTRPARKRATIALETPGTPDDIPVGSINYQTFAEHHAVNDRTFRDHITGGHVPAIEIDKPNRPGQKIRYLSPEQQQRAITYWQENGTAYSSCDNPDCPCNQDTGSLLELEQSI